MLTFTDRATDALVDVPRGRRALGSRPRGCGSCDTAPSCGPSSPTVATDGEVEVAVGTITVLVPAGVEGRVDAGEHNVLTVSAV